MFVTYEDLKLIQNTVDHLIKNEGEVLEILIRQQKEIKVLSECVEQLQRLTLAKHETGR